MNLIPRHLSSDNWQNVLVLLRPQISACPCSCLLWCCRGSPCHTWPPRWKWTDTAPTNGCWKHGKEYTPLCIDEQTVHLNCQVQCKDSCPRNLDLRNGPGVLIRKSSLKWYFSNRAPLSKPLSPSQLCDGDIDEVGVVDHLILNSYLHAMHTVI